MTMDEKLDLILSKTINIESDMRKVKSDVADLKSDVATLKSEVATLKSEVATLKSEMLEVKDRLTRLELHLENTTDRNIRLLAENHSTLIDKLNQAIPVANKNLVYEVKVNYLTVEVDKMKQDIEELKNKIA